MAFSIDGVVKTVTDIEYVGNAQTPKKTVVIETGGQYSQTLAFELYKEKTEMRFTNGQRITVHFDIRGREWNGKYFTSLVAWKVDI